MRAGGRGRTDLLKVCGVALVVLLVGVSVASARPEQQRDQQPKGPLRVLASNPRYFADPSGRPVYLTGSHAWWNLAGDVNRPRCFGHPIRDEPPEPFSYSDYLSTLQRHGHNFVRLWRIELIRWRDCEGAFGSMAVHPWSRPGPARAVDGLPKFDLRRLDPRYFARLRSRVAAAQRAGMYVSVMLFEGWMAQFEEDGWGWRGHPFHPANNVNGVNADLDGDGRGLEVHSLASRRVVAIQEAYVRKVIDTVNGFDNVLYEVANESGTFSTAWQHHMVRFVKRYERRKPKRHPVGMTYIQGDYVGSALYGSAADWISPPARGPATLSDPPPADGRKVVLLDTDHLCGVCGDAAFVWKSFVRGNNPIFMDIFDPDPVREGARRAMGQTRRYARRIDLRRATPRGDLASTEYCLAVPGLEYVVYQPVGGRFTVRLGGRARSWQGEWFDPASGRVQRFGIRLPADVSSFEPPWSGPAVLYLRRSAR
jgi:Family of unknown function (DUF6298)/Putative collagen-binding domain of a collagenase